MRQQEEGLHVSRQEFSASVGRAGVCHRGEVALEAGSQYEEISCHPPSDACSPAYYGQSGHNQGLPAGGEFHIKHFPYTFSGGALK